MTKDRMFICNNCGYKIDRDINAAINLRNLAYKESEDYSDIEFDIA